MKKWTKIAALCLTAALMLAGCGSNAVVPVVQVRMLTRAGGVQERFAGVVVSKNAVEISRDLSQSVEEFCVAAGDEVDQGQVLFRYDSDALDLTLDKQELEQTRLDAEIKEFKKQIKDVEAELKKAKEEALKTQLNIQLRQIQNNLTEAEYELEDLKKEIATTKVLLMNVEVKSPIEGTIRTLDESAEICIVIQQTGAYQVRGSLNELSLDAGIQVGAKVSVISRLDETKTWDGTVVEVDYGNASPNGYDSLYGNADNLTGSSNYPFTVSLESTDGLLLGQHVYIRPVGINEGASDRILIPENYIMNYAYDESTMIISATVWCPDAEGKLTQQQIVLGSYVSELGCYVVVDGLTMDSFVADPANPDCAEGVLTDLRSDEDFRGGMETQATQPSQESGETTQPSETTGIADGETEG